MEKILSLQWLYRQLPLWRQNNVSIVLVTGCFDILHSAHEMFLKNAKKEGGMLIVGLETDKRVNFLKGKGRPVNSLRKRAENLAKLEFVDYIFELPENIGTPEVQESLISGIKPDILAVSSHTSYLDRKKEVVEKFGGKLKIVLAQDSRFSTSKILEDLD